MSPSPAAEPAAQGKAAAPQGKGGKDEVEFRFLPAIRAGLTADHEQLQALADYWHLLNLAARTGEWEAVRPVLEDFHRPKGMAWWLYQAPPVVLDCVAERVCCFSLDANCDGDHSEHCADGEWPCQDPECQPCATGANREEHAAKQFPPCTGCGYVFGSVDDAPCNDCGDCDECCWENHGGEPHPRGGAH